jgi:type III secretory pathway component EscT
MIDLNALRELLMVFAVSITRLMAASMVTPFMARQLIPAQVRNSIIVSWG